MAIKHIKRLITQLGVEDDFRMIENYLGKGILAQKCFPLTFDLNHLVLQRMVVSLAAAFRVAKRYNIETILANQLLSFESFVSGGPYIEALQRYLALWIIENECDAISQALPEHKVFGEKNPDWTIQTRTNDTFYVEVSAISIHKTISDLEAFTGQLQTAKTINASKSPLYFEVIFDGNPRDHDAAVVGKALVEGARKGDFPIQFMCDGVIVNMDLLANRYVRPQIISDELSTTDYLKSTRISEKLVYTLATKKGLKSVERKIDEKKKSNSLDRIGNVWLCIFTDNDLSDMELEKLAATRISQRIKRSSWLRKVIVSRLVNTDGWDLQYYVIN